jgi:hypothetical protein
MHAWDVAAKRRSIALHRRYTFSHFLSVLLYLSDTGLDPSKTIAAGLKNTIARAPDVLESTQNLEDMRRLRQLREAACHSQTRGSLLRLRVLSPAKLINL